VVTKRTGPERWTGGISLGRGSKPMESIGGLFAMAADATKFLFVRPFGRHNADERAVGR